MYYVYTYMIDGVPEYVGKGTITTDRTRRGRQRYMDHFMRAKTTAWGTRIGVVMDSIARIEIIRQDFETEADAFAEERRLIALYGRRDTGGGTLYNRTNGGQGMSGQRYEVTDATRARMSAAAKRRPAVSPETKQLLSEMRRGKPKPVEWREAMSGQRKARFKDPAFRLKMAESGWNVAIAKG